MTSYDYGIRISYEHWISIIYHSYEHIMNILWTYTIISCTNVYINEQWISYFSTCVYGVYGLLYGLQELHSMGIIEAAIHTGHLGRSMSLALHRGAERRERPSSLTGWPSNVSNVEQPCCAVQQYITIWDYMTIHIQVKFRWNIRSQLVVCLTMRDIESYLEHPKEEASQVWAMILTIQP
jgi:hypothetical protein